VCPGRGKEGPERARGTKKREAGGSGGAEIPPGSVAFGRKWKHRVKVCIPKDICLQLRKGSTGNET